MSKTIVALYNNFDHAREAVEDLVEAGFSRNDISIVANNSTGEYVEGTTVTTAEDDVTSGEGARFGAVVGGLIGLGALLIPGIGPVIAAGPLAALLGAGVGAAAGAATGGITAGLIKTGIPEEEANYYAEGIRGGGALVTVSVQDAQVERAESILEDHDPVNVTEQGSVTSTTSTTPTTNTASTAGFTAGQHTVNAGEEARLDVVEEELHVGKREVERGGVRVRSYVTETPVNESVQLREEHITVDRHPVDRAATSADLETFEDGVIEVTERGEEAVVQKTARVVEEVVVGKQVENRTETIQDSVRRKDVVVEDIGGSVTTGTTSWDTYATDFRTDYDTNYANSGYSYEQYTPAYRYGYTLANNEQYRGYDWDRLEPQARTEWESRNPDSWENFKDAVRRSWERVRGR